MFAISVNKAALGALALSFALGLSACAPVGENMPPPGPKSGMGMHHGMVSPEAMGEMERFHREQQALDRDRERMLDKCVNAPKKKAAECRKARRELHKRSEKLHRHRCAAHEKMKAVPTAARLGGLEKFPCGDLKKHQRHRHGSGDKRLDSSRNMPLEPRK